MKERIKKLRKSLNLTQQQFADRIGCSRNLVANYEIGHRNPSSSVINNICKTFNVNEAWLRNGELPMEEPTAETTLDKLALEHHLTPESKTLIEKFIGLNDKQQEAVLRFITDVANSINPDSSRMDDFERRLTAIEEEEAMRDLGGIDAGNNIG